MLRAGVLRTAATVRVLRHCVRAAWNPGAASMASVESGAGLSELRSRGRVRSPESSAWGRNKRESRLWQRKKEAAQESPSHGAQRLFVDNKHPSYLIFRAICSRCGKKRGLATQRPVFCSLLASSSGIRLQDAAVWGEILKAMA